MNLQNSVNDSKSVTKSKKDKKDELLLQQGKMQETEESKLEKEKEKKLVGVRTNVFNLNVVFVCDATGSMQPVIRTVEEKVIDIANLTRRKFRENNDEFDEVVVNFAFVAYRDHCDGNNRIQLHQWNTPESLPEFLAGVRAFGGGDAPECVQGGLYEASKLLTEAKGTNIVCLISDCPPHGITNHEISMSDSYPDECPGCPTFDNIILELEEKNNASLLFVDCAEVYTRVMRRKLSAVFGNKYQQIPLRRGDAQFRIEDEISDTFVIFMNIN